MATVRRNHRPDSLVPGLTELGAMIVRCFITWFDMMVLSR